MTQNPFEIFGADRPSNILITCDHATNRVPECVGGGSLGLSDTDMNRHIAYDVGARAVSILLGELLNAPVICSNFSRLVIDPNRGEDDPTLLMKLYDGTMIPANRFADAQEIERRLNAFHRPYHTALAKLAARQDDTVIISMHSFTPQLKGRPKRPWEIGVLYAHDDRLAQSFLRILKDEVDLCVGDNQPYNGALPGDAIDRHALQTSRLNLLIEIRNDLIEHADGQSEWASRLAPLITKSIDNL